MAYFPFYIDIKDKKFLVVGGGKVAFRKVEKLLPQNFRHMDIKAKVANM